jgi:hypothetical protein
MGPADDVKHVVEREGLRTGARRGRDRQTRGWIDRLQKSAD